MISGPHTSASSSLVMSDSTFRELRETIYRQSGIHFADNKKELLESKIAKRLTILGFSTFEQYLNLINSPAQAKTDSKEIYNTITINETYFFRSLEQIAVLKDIIIPEIIRNKQDSPKVVRIWSAATSTGEEAYTLAMVILEKIKPLYPDVQFEIWASDINTASLEAARRGLYREYAIKDTPHEYFSKYFKKLGEVYEVHDAIKQMVKFGVINLYDSANMQKMKNFDVIFCCNVLIYFDLPSKQRVLSNLYASLNNKSYLFIGYSESLHGVPKAFKLVHLPKAMAYKKE